MEALIRKELSKMGVEQSDANGLITCFQDTGYACSTLAAAIQEAIKHIKI
jgi:hypothetical protein